MTNEEVNERLRAELDNTKLRLTDLAHYAGIAYSTLFRKLSPEGKIRPNDIINWGNFIEINGGNPNNVWPNYTQLRNHFLAKKELETEKPTKITVANRPVIFADGSLNNKTEQTLIIPGFINLNFWIRVYSSDIQCEKYAPGMIFALQEVEDIKHIIPGLLYYLHNPSFEYLRIIESVDPDYKLTVRPLNPSLKSHVFNLKGNNKIYNVKGVIAAI